MQLLLTTRAWMVLARSLIQQDELPPEVRNEQALHLLLLGAAAGKEAADAFRECDRLCVFSEITVAPLNNIPDPFSLARRERDKDNRYSLYNQVLVLLRNNAGFHWSRKLLKRGLSEVADIELYVAKGGATTFDSAIPVAEVLAAEVLRSQGIAPKEMPEVFKRTTALLDCLRHIADTTVALTIYRSTEESS